MAGVLAHDICQVELAGVADGRAVDDAVAAALRLPTSGRSSSGDDQLAADVETGGIGIDTRQIAETLAFRT